MKTLNNHSQTFVEGRRELGSQLIAKLFLLMAEIRRSPVEVGSLSHYLGGGNSNIFCFHPYFGEVSNSTFAYFSNGLVQPPTSY